jgi:hypothetical protein
MRHSFFLLMEQVPVAMKNDKEGWSEFENCLMRTVRGEKVQARAQERAKKWVKDCPLRSLSGLVHCSYCSLREEAQER